MDTRLALMTGVDIPIPELQTVLHQPTITEISRIGEESYFTGIQFLTLDKRSLVQDESLLESLTNFQVLMKVIEQPETKEYKASIIQVLSLFFPGFQATITPNGFLLFQGDQTIIIDNNNFDILQDLIKLVGCTQSLHQGQNVAYNPKSAKAKEIARKLMRGRERVASLKAENKESVISRYLSILTVGLHSMSLQDCLALTMYQLFDLVERYTLYNEWDIDLRVRLAGGDPKSEVENWMKSIH